MSQRDFVPALGVRALTRFYDPVVAMTTREARFKRLLLEQASPDRGQQVLDLGCGTGTLAIMIQESEPAARVHGVDADGEVLAQAVDKAAARGLPEIRFEEGHSDKLPYPDGSFDLVISTLLFHHLPTAVKRDTVAEVARVLRPDGQLHIADWGKPSDRVMRLLSLSIRLLDGIRADP